MFLKKCYFALIMFYIGFILVLMPKFQLLLIVSQPKYAPLKPMLHIYSHDTNTSQSLKTPKPQTRPADEKCPRSYATITPNNLNCSDIFNGREKALEYHKQKLAIPSDYKFYRYCKSCDWIRNQLNSSNYYVSEEEKQFPLAFALNVYQSPYQIFRFLKVIYRPHNLHCLHYDKKSHESFKKFMIAIAECLPNVIVPKKIEDVIWGWHTIMDAQMNCLNDLYELRNKYPWKYAITLCGKEVPLRTNREMVDTLRKLNGTSGIQLKNLKLKPHESDRWKFKYYLDNKKVRKSNETLPPVPFNFTIVKSSAYVSLSESLVEYLFQNKVAIQFRKFFDNNTKVPEEYFIPSLAIQKDVPGGRNERFASLIPAIASAIWETEHSHCKGIFVHNICIVTSEDLHRLDHSYNPDKDHQTFFHNKFFIERDRVVMDCAEEELLRRNGQECLRDSAGK